MAGFDREENQGETRTADDAPQHSPPHGRPNNQRTQTGGTRVQGNRHLNHNQVGTAATRQQNRVTLDQVRDQVRKKVNSFK